MISITEWHRLLNWEHSPNFQTCHRHDKIEDFEMEYYKSDEINNLIDNIFVLLKTPGSSNARLMGKMGSGKTTFLHYLKRSIINNKISEEIFFVIIRTGRIDLSNYEESLKHIFIDHVFKKFFYFSNNFEEYDRMIEKYSDNIGLCLQKLQNYYFDNNDRFDRKLIVVLDDMDTLENEDDVRNITVAFKRISGSGDKINKWVSLRGNTYSHYSEELKQKFTFFQQPYTLPTVSLFDIVEKRIKAKNPNGKNPFSKELCDTLMKFRNDSIRDCLGMLPMILENASLPNRNQSEEFIQNWMKKGAITTLLRQGLIKNIHSEEFIIIYNYPLVFDILNIIKYTKIKDEVYTLISFIGDKIRGNLLNRTFHFIEKQVNVALKVLEKNNLLVIDDEVGRVSLSNIGNIIVSFRPETYNKVCKELFIEGNQDIDSEYWEVLSKRIPYKNIVKNRYSQNRD